MCDGLNTSPWFSLSHADARNAQLIERVAQPQAPRRACCTTHSLPDTVTRTFLSLFACELHPNPIHEEVRVELRGCSYVGQPSPSNQSLGSLESSPPPAIEEKVDEPFKSFAFTREAGPKRAERGERVMDGEGADVGELTSLCSRLGGYAEDESGRAIYVKHDECLGARPLFDPVSRDAPAQTGKVWCVRHVSNHAHALAN